jgi:hypothetical protein
MSILYTHIILFYFATLLPLECRVYKILFIIRMSIKYFLIISIIIFSVNTLTKQTNLTSKLPKIETLYFIESPKL